MRDQFTGEVSSADSHYQEWLDAYNSGRVTRVDRARVRIVQWVERAAVHIGAGVGQHAVDLVFEIVE